MGLEGFKNLARAYGISIISVSGKESKLGFGILE